MNAPATTAEIVVEIERTFGTPLLAWEDAEVYRAVLTGLVNCFSPRDYFEKMILSDMAHAAWGKRRYARTNSLTIERQAFTNLERQQKRRALEAERPQRKAE